MSSSEFQTISTVGDLIDQLQAFDHDLPIRTAHGVTGNDDNWEWIISVAPIPPSGTMIGIIYIPPPK
jgi:hypothetical protein